MAATNDPSPDISPDVGTQQQAVAASDPGTDQTRTASAATGGRAAFHFGHYAVLTHADGSAWVLGQGAMGVTYKALDARLHCHVAVKVIKAELLAGNPAVRGRFLREARAAAQLRHPNIASVFHLGETADGQAFYAMEFIEGETLAARLQRLGPLPVGLVLEIGIEVARALVAAEQQGFIHRDLKPANLMLVAGMEERENEPGTSGSATGAVRVKVIDFGLAKAVVDHEPLSVMGDFLGTPQFASPEQFTDNDHRADYRSDIYSLGVTLWYALTGRLPFPGRSSAEVRSRQLSDPLPVAQLNEARVPAPLAALLVDMLAADPDKRPQSSFLVLDALSRCREPIQPAPARPAAIPMRRRHWSIWLRAAGALAAAVVLIAAVVGGLRLARRQGGMVAPPVAETIPEKSIAVLPFENRSADKENAFFAEGVQDEILTDLAKVSDLKVISRTSVLQYKSGSARNLREIAAQLSVANVVEGSVQRAGSKVRITADLINARTDTHLWAERYDRDLSDIFAIQSEIARTIADQLRATLSPQEKAAIGVPPTTDLQAYDLFLRARVLYLESSVTQLHEKLLQATRLLDNAVERDPKFLSAWCLLARVHGDRYFGGDDHTATRLDQATAAIQAAVRLQPDAGATHLALADYYYHGFRDYDHARQELDLARRTLPNNAEVYEYTGYIDRRQSRWKEATLNLQRAVELDPRNFSTLQQMGLTYLILHRYEDVRLAWDRSLAIVPTDPGGRIYRAYLDITARGDVRRFQTTLAALLAEDPRVAPYVDDPNYALCERTPTAAARTLANYPGEGSANMGAVYPHAYWEGLIARWQGDAARARIAFTAARAEVQKVLDTQPDLAPALSVLAMIDAGLGRKDQAIAEGRRACELLPLNKDALAAAVIGVNFAQTLSWAGEKAAAIEQIALVERAPSELGYGLLKLHPRWDDLRGDARFEALVSKLSSDPGF